jgi:hypothetical protein
VNPATCRKVSSSTSAGLCSIASPEMTATEAGVLPRRVSARFAVTTTSSATGASASET